MASNTSSSPVRTNPPDLLTTKEAAEYLNCSPEHVRRMIRAGRMPGVVLTEIGLIRIRTDALLGQSR